MSNFDLSSLALKSAFPNNVILTDDKGLPSVMVYIPKFKMSDVITGATDSTHPAFIVDGVEKDGIYISKYQNVAYNSRAYSLPGEETPKHRLTPTQPAPTARTRAPAGILCPLWNGAQSPSGARKTAGFLTAITITVKTPEKRCTKPFRPIFLIVTRLLESIRTVCLLALVLLSGRTISSLTASMT